MSCQLLPTCQVCITNTNMMLQYTTCSLQLFPVTAIHLLKCASRSCRFCDSAWWCATAWLATMYVISCTDWYRYSDAFVALQAFLKWPGLGAWLCPENQVSTQSCWVACGVQLAKSCCSDQPFWIGWLCNDLFVVLPLLMLLCLLVLIQSQVWCQHVVSVEPSSCSKYSRGPL